MTEPTDAEIAACIEAAQVKCVHPDAETTIEIARAVLAKWGTPPAVAGEPVAPDFYTVCALYEGGGATGWIPLPGYSNETEHGVKHLVLEAARKEGYKGTAAGRLLELGWEIRPVYLTPQPTQAQAGAVPLTDEQIDAVAESMPGGLDGFLKGWGWRQFAREILTLRRMPDWEPKFDCMTPKQEELAVQFCQEIAGPRGKRGSPPDPVRLLDMAEALYKAEREAAHGIKGGQHGPS